MKNYTARPASELNPVLTELQKWRHDGMPRSIADLEALASRHGLSESRQVIESWIAMTGVKLGSPLQVFVPFVGVTDDGQRKGRLVECELTLVETKPDFADYARWIMRPVHDKPFRKVKKDFLESLDHARQAVIALDTKNSLWPDYQPWVIQYHFKGLAAEEEIGGGSAGCMMALGAALLLARNMPRAAHRYHSILAELSRQVLFDKFTATASITNDGRLTSVEGVQLKLGTSGRIKIAHFIISREQTFHLEQPLPITQSWSRLLAWSRQHVPCSTLSEALHAIVICSGADPSFRFRKNRRLTFKVMVAIFLGIAAFFHFGFIYPSNDMLSNRMKDDNVAFTDVTTPDRISTVSVHIPTTTDYKWVNDHLPPLKGLHWPPFLRMQRTFDLTLGRMWSPDKAKDSVTLADFGSLKSLRQLTLLQGPVTQLQGAETLHNLESFISLGGRVSDLRWLRECQRLNLLILDSGFIEDYSNFSFINLETLITRLPDTIKRVPVSDLPQLRRLAVRSDKAKDFHNLRRLSRLEQVILHLEDVEPDLLVFPPLPNQIRFLELARCSWLHEFDVGKAAQGLQVLVLRGTQFDELYLENAPDLEELHIESDSSLEILDLTGLAQLKKLRLKDCAIREVKGLGSCARLKQIECENLFNLEALDLKDANALESLHIIKSALRSLENLQDCVNLSMLGLDQCPVEKLSGLTQARLIQRLHLRETRLEELEDLVELELLEYLDLTKSPLQRLPDFSPKALVDIRIGDTEVAKELDSVFLLNWVGSQLSTNGRVAIDVRGLARMRSGGYYYDTSKLEYGGYKFGYGGGSYYTSTPIYTYSSLLKIPTGEYTLTTKYANPVYSLVQFDGWPPEAETEPETPKFNTLEIMRAFAPHIQLPESFEPPYWLTESEDKIEKPFQRRSRQQETNKDEGSGQ